MGLLPTLSKGGLLIEFFGQFGLEPPYIRLNWHAKMKALILYSSRKGTTENCRGAVQLRDCEVRERDEIAGSG